MNHCGWCGGKLLGEEWPKTCSEDACGQITYKNPKPVVVLIANGRLEDGRAGPIMVKRAIQPGLGRWALPGGFVDDNETAEEAASREYMEETGIEIDPQSVFPTHTFNTGFGHLLIFCELFGETIEPEEIESFQPNTEVSEIALFHQDLDICFDSHKDAIDRWLASPVR